MTLNSIFAGAIGIGIVGAVGYGIYKGLKGDKPSKARLAMRARTTPSKASVPTPVPVVETTVPTPAPVVETSAPTPAPIATTVPASIVETTVPAPAPASIATPIPIVEITVPAPNEITVQFISYAVKEAVMNGKTRVSIKDLRAEAHEDLFEKYDGEIYSEDLQWFNAAVEEKVQEFVKEAEDAGLRVLR